MNRPQPPPFPLTAILVAGLVLGTAGCTRAGDPAARKPEGGDFFPLAAAGVTYATPAGWTVIDPPREHAAIGPPSPGGLLIFVQKNLAVAAFRPDPGTTVTVAVQGPSFPYDGMSRNPLSHVAETAWVESWWKETHPLVTDRVEATVTLADGTELPARQARMLPGLLAGEDVIHALAWGEVRGRYVVIDAASTTAHTEDLLGPVRTIAAALRVEGDGAPDAIADPGKPR